MKNFRRSLSIACAAVTLGFIAYICAFQLLDRDFWWHIKAGELMLRTHQLIRLDPFAYTRAGQPYLATYEWLAQIILYLVYHLTGGTGVIVFRTLMVAVTFFLLLSIDGKSLWPNGLLVIWAANVARPGFVERPQLFTYVIFAAFLRIAYFFLERTIPSRLPQPGGEEGTAHFVPARFRDGFPTPLFFGFVALQILWVNFHGGACLLGFAIIGALWMDQAYEAWQSGWKPGLVNWPASVRFPMLLMGALFVAFFLSPNTYHSLTYTFHLFSDGTAAFIQEWKPRPLGVYLRELGPFWIMALLSLALNRKGRVFSLLILCATGFLSLRALRHEMLFVFTAVGVMVFQLKHSVAAKTVMRRLLRHRALAVASTAFLLVPLGIFSRQRHLSASQSDHLFTSGYGVFDLAKGASDFLERENIKGPLFNTYGIGGYLLYRGFPVFIDGRNVDYGFNFMMQAFLAGRDPAVWKSLERRYGFSCAVIDYDANKQKDYFPYSVHLNTNPSWKLVYLDDWAAVYLKDTPENRSVISRSLYRLLTPERLEDKAWLDAAASRDESGLESELRRVVDSNPKSVKGRIALATFYLRRHDLSAARALVDAARAQQPLRPEIYEARAAIAAQEENWKEAGRSYKEMLRLAGDSYHQINYRFIGDTFAKAGDHAEAWRYWKKDKQNKPDKVGPLEPMSSTPSSASSIPIPKIPEDKKTKALAQKLAHQIFQGIARDKVRHNDLGVDLAGQGKFEEAKEEFRSALALDPGFSEANNNLASVLYREKRYEEAVVYYERALEKNPRYADAHYNLSKAFLHLSRFEQSEKQAEAAKKFGRDTTEILAILAQHLGQQP